MYKINAVKMTLMESTSKLDTIYRGRKEAAVLKSGAATKRKGEQKRKAKFPPSPDKENLPTPTVEEALAAKKLKF